MPYRKLFPERASTPRGHVYLLHFHEPFGNCRHYIGFAVDLSSRIREHAISSSRSTPFMLAVNRAGIPWELARVWENMTLRDEYRIKNWGGAGTKGACPICRAQRRYEKVIERQYCGNPYVRAA